MRLLVVNNQKKKMKKRVLYSFFRTPGFEKEHNSLIDCIASFLNNMGISQTFKFQKWFFFKESTLFYNFLECQCHYFTKMMERGLQNLYYSLGLHRIIIICNSIVFQAQELPWVLLRNRWTTSFRFMYVR